MFHLKDTNLTGNAYKVTININGKILTREIDTGASLSLVLEQTYKYLWLEVPLVLEQTKKNLWPEVPFWSKHTNTCGQKFL